MRYHARLLAKKLKKASKQHAVLFVFLVSFIIVGFVLGKNEGLLRQLARRSNDTVTAKELKKLLTQKSFTFINVHIPYEGEIEKTDNYYL